MDRSSITQLLSKIRDGEDKALDNLLPFVYRELHDMASKWFSRERAEHTLQPTAIVHEVYLKLCDGDLDLNDRVHFFAVASRAMRHLLTDHARQRRADKRGRQWHRLTLIDDQTPGEGSSEVDLVALDEALTKLARLNERHARIVEHRFFGGLSVKEISEVLGVTRRTIELDWRLARAWLRSELS